MLTTNVGRDIRIFATVDLYVQGAPTAPPSFVT
jgi:hypothetical protein